MQQRLETAGRGVGLLLLVLLLPCCASGPAEQRACTGRQIVIGFAPGVDAALPATALSLSRAAGVSVLYMRHLFDHYSLYCAGAGGEPPVTEAVLQRLRDRADILSVETDSVRHPARSN